jgi:hypothetical protein
MYIGKRLLIKHEGKIQEGLVQRIFQEELDIKLTTGEVIRRKFWEVRIIDEKNKE